MKPADLPTRGPTTLRRRLTLMAALAVGISVLGAAVASYVALRSHLRGQADDALRTQGALVAERPAIAMAIRAAGSQRGGPELIVPQRERAAPTFEVSPRDIPPPDSPPNVLRTLPAPPPRAGPPADFIQLIDAHGVPRARNRGSARLPVGASERAVAAGRRRQALRDAEVAGSHVRVLTRQIPGRGAIQLAQALDATDRVLARMRWTLGVICLIALAAAIAASRFLARPVVAPIAAVTDAAEHIEATADLSRRVPAAGDDEVGRMAARFNAMLDRLAGSQHALAESTAAQRQLVADASHELRTPVTSLRTNAEVLLAAEDLDDQQRRALLEDVVAQTEELSALVGDLIELARGDVPAATRADVRLDEVVGEAVARARRRAPGVEFAVDLLPTVVVGDPERLSRAVGNLLDNAVKHSPDAGRVEVSVRDGEVVVRDHGPGIPADEAPHVFERFYRGARARGQPGSGLGLAIVKQVAEGHGGTVFIEPAADGGTVARLRLPPA